MATFNSDILTAKAPAKWFTTDKSTYGTVTIADAVVLTQNDIIGLCKIPANSQITDFVIDLPDLDSSTTLVLNLQDDGGAVLPGTTTTQANPTIYVLHTHAGQAGGIVSIVDIAHAVLGSSYAAQQQLNLLVTTTASALSGPVVIYFKVSFSPT